MQQIHLDLNNTRPLNDIWRFGFNTCHVPLWLRDDMQRHLEMGARELGFRYVRAHNMLSDRMHIMQSGGYDFSLVNRAIDNLLLKGLRPFVELSSLPSELVGGEKSLTSYGFKSSPPQDWNAWHQLVRALVENFAQRYGLAEIRQWYFEVWNEPDIGFWNGTQAEYFKLYDLAARAVKEVDAQLRVGGPATSKTAWIDEFLAHIAQPSPDFGLDMPRCDFVSTHAYPSDLAYLEGAQGEVKLQNSTIMRELYSAVRRKVDAALGEGFPVFCGEWNSSAGPLAWNHDECNNAPFIAKTLIELSELCQGSLYWTLSDIYEECGFHFEPFHGGYGVITVNDIRKSGFHACRFLTEHRGERIELELPENLPLTALATREENTLRVLLAHYQEPDAPAGEATQISLAGLPEVASARLEIIEPGAGSAYETWRELGSPCYATASLLAQLELASKPRTQNFDASQPLQLAPCALAQLTIQLKAE